MEFEIVPRETTVFPALWAPNFETPLTLLAHTSQGSCVPLPLHAAHLSAEINGNACSNLYETP